MSDKVFQVITAASKGSLEDLKKAFESGSSANVIDYDRRTPLHLAAAEGHLETVKYLVEEKKVDINATDRFGNTPLQDAINSRYFLVAQYLRDKGAVSKQYDDLVVSLCRAASKNDVERIKALLEEGADVNSADYDGRTALHLAASEGHYEAAELLISMKASVNIIDRWGSTPLQDAVSHGHDKISELLMKYGARVEKDIHKIRDNAQFYSALQKAINLLCDKEKWEYAMAWVPHLEKNEIKPTDAWYGQTSGVNLFAQYRRACETVILAPGQGLVGQVYESKKPIWIRDTSADSYKEFGFMGEQKGQIPKEIGFKSAVGIPVIYNDTLVAILEFRSTLARESNQDSITFSSNVATRAVVSSAISDSPGQDKKSLQVKLKGVYAEQMNVVYRLLLQEGMFSEAVILSELDWFYNGLGLNEYYFQHHSPHLIAKHILSYIAAKKYAQTTGTSEKIRFIDEEPSFGLYICPVEESIMIERMIEEKYFGEGYLGTSASIETGSTSSFALKHFLSEGTASPTSSQRIALYLVDNYPFVNAKASENESDLWKVATGVFLRDKSSSAKLRYQKALTLAVGQLAPAVLVEEDPLEPTNCVVVVAYKKGSTHSFLSTLTQLIANNKYPCPRKYIEQFSNGYVIHSIHLRTGLEEATLFAEQAKLLYMLPRTTLTPLFAEGKLTLNEMVYAYACWKFAYHFMARSSVDEFNLLWKALAKDPESQARLLQLKKRMRNDVLTEQRISDAIFDNWQLVKDLYRDFEAHHKPATPKPSRPTGINAELEAKIKKAVADIDYDVLRAFLQFNASVVKTNFYIKNKAALSFRFDTGFLRGSDYPQLPYAILMFVGAEFRGFHVRFDDIARGGLRMIRSANKQAYLRNAETLFDENYNLAWTQEKKNKDIPESGSKGTILLSIDHQNKAFIAFKKYIDAMLDLLLPNADIVDHYGQPEYIFCGPDEGTADVMDWACLHAKSRGYRFWTGFTTGKSVSLGGIPHDLYGMTTRGVHEYVLGIMNKLNIKEESVFKLQTGGPDGDLGSNEIKISKDKTKAVIDGSGVLYDPNGIDRTELLRLANKRAMVQEFDTSKLSKDGFLILIKDKDVKLPNGTVVENGMMFRNLFHLNPMASCELFVPCGGRPEAVNLNNVDKLFFPDGTPMFKYVVEGANLFFTQEARLKLEEAGVVVFKDASANKGGVTSSSMEVLAALALSEEEYIQHMCVKDGKTPEFYEKYVVEVQNKIADNARQEFECIWNEHERTGTYRCLLTDQLSIKINTLTQEVKNSGLWKDEKMRKKILLEALPQTLLSKISIEKIVERVPTNYLEALLSAHLASRYIYQAGLNPNEFSFYMFMAKYLEQK